MSRTLPKIFKEEEGAEETKGEHARLSAYVGAIAVADLVKTTLGPKGMDKILQSTDRQEKCIFTNDGATILKSVPVDNPAAKIIVDMSKTQDSEVGDGTTSVAVLAGEILREAEKLVTLKIHPQTIIRGWRKAVGVARKALEDSALDHSDDKEQFRQDLLNVARTTLSSKILSAYKDHFANLCVDAVLRLKGSNDLERIQILKKAGAGLKDSYLEEGFILDAKRSGVGQPKRVENARILLANTALDTDKIKVHGATVRVDSVAKVAEIEKAEKKKMQDKVAKIIAHDINCFISRQLIYNLPEQIFTENKIMAIEHADFEGIERLAFVLGGEITSTFEDPKRVRLGTCKLIEETQIGEDQVIRFRGCGQGEACTIVIRAASEHILDEAERSLHDVLCVLIQTISSNKIVYGGGWSEILMGKAVDDFARHTGGKEQLVIESFARALRALPAIIADNAGFDSIELVSELRLSHEKENSRAGIDIEQGIVGDMEKLAVIESLRAKMMVLVSAHEAAEMILRVDEIIKAAPRKRRAKGHGH